MMVQTAFLTVLGMSMAASLVIPAVILVRLPLKKAPKIFSYALWIVVLFRLLCPFSIESPVSMIPAVPEVEAQQIDSAFSDYGFETFSDRTENESTLANKVEGKPYVLIGHSAPPSIWLTALWMSGVAGMLLYSAVSYFKLRRKLVGAVPLRDNIYLADHITSPFVMGLLRPKIYLPSSLSEREQEYIILHEQYHIRRMDHAVKLLSFAALCVHWFNPLVWAAFVLSGRDMEMSCDEAVVKKLGESIRADYSASLLSLATGCRIIAGTPLAFGEGDTSGRIKNLAKWKKPALWVIAAAVAVVVLVAIVCGTNSQKKADLEVTPLDNGVELVCNFKEPIRSWAIYEDIYSEGELISSTPFIMQDFQEYYDPSDRRFTAQLTYEPVQGENGFGGTLQLLFEQITAGGSSKATCSRDLPGDHYTAMAFLPAEDDWNAGAMDDVILFSVFLSVQADGRIRAADLEDAIADNNTVALYRLVTTTEGLDSFASWNASE